MGLYLGEQKKKLNDQHMNGIVTIVTNNMDESKDYFW